MLTFNFPIFRVNEIDLNLLLYSLSLVCNLCLKCCFYLIDGNYPNGQDSDKYEFEDLMRSLFLLLCDFRPDNLNLPSHRLHFFQMLVL